MNFITVTQIISGDGYKLKLGQHSTILEGHCAGGFVSVRAEFTLNEGEILRLRLRMTLPFHCEEARFIRATKQSPRRREIASLRSQ
ncbi:MAG: hypothetical protein MUO61_03950 [Dehalococcoidia bacterium]|nr:hypothetical protein [Dehalococcoidia bacterium]